MGRRRKLILASLDWIRKKDPPFALGHASIVANFMKRRVPVIHQAWSVNTSNFDPKKVVDFALDHADSHSDFALGAFVWNESYTQEIIKELRKRKFPGRIILGGPQISYVKPSHASSIDSYYPQADIFIRGYAEQALADLMLSKVSSPMIPGVHYAGEPDLGFSASIELDELPSPFLTGMIKPQKFIRWETQRGCPFRCSFCQHRESDVSMIRREFPVNRVFKEAEWITSNPIISDVAVLDPTFNSGPHYISILEALTVGRYSGKLALQCRPEMVKTEFLDAVEKLNQTANVVLEFGLQTIHKDEWVLIQRPTNLKKVTQVLEETRRRNISVEVSLIFGLPQQTLASFKKSVVYCKQLGVPTIYAFPLMLLRGTPLYEQKETLGLIESNEPVSTSIDRQQQGISHVVSSPTFSYLDWRNMVKISEELQHYNTNNRGQWQPSSTNNGSMFFSSNERVILKTTERDCSIVSPGKHP